MLHAIRKDVLGKFVGEVISRSIFLLFFFYLGRKLSTEEFGTLNLALSTTYMLGVLFLDPGLTISTVKLLVARPETARRTAGAVFCFKVLAFVPMLIVLWIGVINLPSRLPGLHIMMAAALYTFLYALLEYFCYLTNAYHRMDLEAWIRTGSRLSVIALGLIAIHFGSMAAIIWAMCIATLLWDLIATRILARNCTTVRPVWDVPAMKLALREGLPVAGAAIIGAIYLKWDLLVLSYFHVGREQVGWYAGAFKIVEAFSALPSLLGVALFPVLVQLRTENPGYLDRLLLTTIKAVLLFSIPTAAVISLFSRQIVTLVYGSKYLPGADVLAVLIWCIVPMFMYFYLTFVNIAAGHAKYNLLAGGITLIAGLTANSLLVPRVGYMGAAWSALVANSTFALLATWKVCTLYRNANIPSMLLRLGTAAALMMATFFLTSASLSIQLLFGLLVYAIVLIALGTLGADDVSLALRLLERRIQPQAQGS
jgi:O-antigen/teichoic acid export membrane protein